MSAQGRAPERKRPSKPNIGKGDFGFTGFIGAAVAYKSSWQAEACGTVDELNTVIGEAHARNRHPEVRAALVQVSKDLFSLGADIATTLTGQTKLPQITTAHVHRLEDTIVHFEENLPPLKTFILPIGPAEYTILHHARTVCRRSERQMVRFLKDRKKSERANPLTLAYLNRLSDVLFTLARFVLQESGAPAISWTRADA